MHPGPSVCPTQQPPPPPGSPGQDASEVDFLSPMTSTPRAPHSSLPSPDTSITVPPLSAHPPPLSLPHSSQGAANMQQSVTMTRGSELLAFMLLCLYVCLSVCLCPSVCLSVCLISEEGHRPKHCVFSQQSWYQPPSSMSVCLSVCLSISVCLFFCLCCSSFVFL